MFKRLALTFALIAALMAPAPAAFAQQGSLSDTYSGEELVATGGAFFGSVAQGLASLIERAVSQFGLPNGYILGEDAGGALFAGARYGEGTLYTRNAGELPMFWQGPSIGFDVGGDGSKVMMLVYNLSSIQEIYGRFAGVDGSAYVIGGLRHDGDQIRQCGHGPHPLRRRRPAGAQCRLSQIHARSRPGTPSDLQKSDRKLAQAGVLAPRLCRDGTPQTR